MKRLILAALLCLVGEPVLASEDRKSRLSGSSKFELKDNLVMTSDNDSAEKNTVSAKIKTALDYAITDRLTLMSYFKFEQMDQAPSRNPGAGEDMVLQSHGIFVEEIKLSYALNNQWTLFGGKFNPTYGSAYSERGLADDVFANDYELTEKIGGGARYEGQAPGIGQYGVEASTFFSDRSILGEALVTQRDRLRLSDGGAANTHDFKSLAVSAAASDLLDVEGLSALAGYRFQHKGDADTAGRHESGVVSGASYTWPVTSEITLKHKVELARTFNADGMVNSGSGAFQDRDYVYLNTVATWDHWDLSLSWAQRGIDNGNGGDDYHDELADATLGYQWDSGLRLQGGGFRLDRNGTDSLNLGGKLAYELEF